MKRFLLLCAILFSAAIASATLSPGVTISSITVSGTTGTVTCSSACGMISNDPGGCIAGSSVTADNGCYAVTVTSSTVFTFSSSTATACASSCGTAQPGLNFIISGDPFAGIAGIQLATACVWTYQTTPLPISGKTTSCSSAFSSSIAVSSGISSLLTPINAALASGQWVENTSTLFVALSDTTANIEQELQRQQFQAQLQLTTGAAAIALGRDIGTACNGGGCNQ
jgi:hypothetical protein